MALDSVRAILPLEQRKCRIRPKSRAYPMDGRPYEHSEQRADEFSPWDARGVRGEQGGRRPGPAMVRQPQPQPQPLGGLRGPAVRRGPNPGSAAGHMTAASARPRPPPRAAAGRRLPGLQPGGRRASQPCALPPPPAAESESRPARPRRPGQGRAHPSRAPGGRGRRGSRVTPPLLRGRGRRASLFRG
jgi:hypothetical protein